MAGGHDELSKNNTYKNLFFRFSIGKTFGVQRKFIQVIAARLLFSIGFRWQDFQHLQNRILVSIGQLFLLSLRYCFGTEGFRAWAEDIEKGFYDGKHRMRSIYGRRIRALSAILKQSRQLQDGF